MHSGSTDLMVFVCLVTLQDHVTNTLYDFMVRNPSRYVTILTSLKAIDSVVVEI